jgi:hypothetical protein
MAHIHPRPATREEILEARRESRRRWQTLSRKEQREARRRWREMSLEERRLERLLNRTRID